MTGFDVAVLVLVGAGAVLGFSRGFVAEVLALAAWVFAIFAIHELHSPLSDALLPFIHSESGAAVLAFAILLLVPYGVTKLVAGQLGKLAKNSGLGPIDRLLGFGFGAVKGVIITVIGFSVLMLGYDTIWGAKGRPQWITQARTYPLVNAGSNALVSMLGERRAEAEAASGHASREDDSADNK